MLKKDSNVYEPINFHSYTEWSINHVIAVIYVWAEPAVVPLRSGMSNLSDRVAVCSKVCICGENKD